MHFLLFLLLLLYYSWKLRLESLYLHTTNPLFSSSFNATINWFFFVYNTHGHCHVPQDYPPHPTLGRWFQRQCSICSFSALSKDSTRLEKRNRGTPGDQGEAWACVCTIHRIRNDDSIEGIYECPPIMNGNVPSLDLRLHSLHEWWKRYPRKCWYGFMSLHGNPLSR